MPRLSQSAPVQAGEIAVAGATNGGMLEPLLAGLLAGWGVAIPLGAIGVMIVDLGMRGGFRPAAAAAAGVATADLLYAAVAAAAGAAAAAALAPHAHALRLISAAVLAALGAYGLLAARRAAAIGAAHPAAPAARPAAPPAGPRVYARFLALTSINPLTVAYFAALIAGLPAVSSSTTGAKVAFVLAAGAASLSWQLVLAGAGAALHHRLPPSARLYTALAGNAIVLALALRLAVAA
jgi:threonine/homoserine/homoserine lactone efflux protein